MKSINFRSHARMPCFQGVNVLNLMLVFLYLVGMAKSHKIHKCCPLGKLLSGAKCISMKSGTALPKILVEGSMVSFKELKDQKILRQGNTPRCVKKDQMFPQFIESNGSAKEYFSQDGVFVSQSLFFKPGAYCVDGEADSVGEDDEEQSSHIKVVVCGERGESMGGCMDGQDHCYPRYQEYVRGQ